MNLRNSLNKMRDNFIRSMQGRYIMYGTDSFSRFLFGLVLLLIFINIIIGSSLLSLIEFVIFVYAYYRLFSKNISKRYHENEMFEKYKNKYISFFKNFKYNINQAKTYHIYKCPNCGQKIRIPRGKGKIMVRCPKCYTEFQKKS